MKTNPHVVFTLFKGKMVMDQKPRRPERANFVICCLGGDWSGFRTLAECQTQFAELEAKGRSDGYFWVEER
jgi:hypothetical protein